MDARALYDRLRGLAELAARVSARYPDSDTGLLAASLRELAAMSVEQPGDGPYRGVCAGPTPTFEEVSVHEQAWQERARDRANLRILALEDELRALRAKVGDG